MEPGNYNNIFLARRGLPCYLLCMTPREAELTAALAASEQQVAELKQENELLKQKIDALVRRIFGAGSEPERSGDRPPQAARRVKAQPESKNQP